MNGFIENIDRQIEFNKNKNILLENIDMFRFRDETVNSVAGIADLAPDAKQLLINHATDKAIEEFCRINQYYSFDADAKDSLKNIYTELFENFRAATISVDSISEIHYKNLKRWLIKSNPFAERMYKNADKEINPVACSEYSSELQINILKINIGQLKQPILDLGCGSKGMLVNRLKKEGLEVLGIDRYKFATQGFETADWLDYDYGIKRWGTIVSNLGFSNHFNHHNLREDGNYIEYAKTYMNILHSLKTGGKFHYAPDLPFIEKYLDGNQFSVKKYEISDYDFKTSVITRLK